MDKRFLQATPVILDLTFLEDNWMYALGGLLLLILLLGAILLRRKSRKGKAFRIADSDPRDIGKL